MKSIPIRMGRLVFNVEANIIFSVTTFLSSFPWLNLLLTTELCFHYQHFADAKEDIAWKVMNKNKIRIIPVRCFLKPKNILDCWAHTACYWSRAADGDKAQGTLSITFVCSKSSNELSLPLIRLFSNASLLIISQHYGRHYLQNKFISFSWQLYKKKIK